MLPELHSPAYLEPTWLGLLLAAAISKCQIPRATALNVEIYCRQIVQMYQDKLGGRLEVCNGNACDYVIVEGSVKWARDGRERKGMAMCSQVMHIILYVSTGTSVSIYTCMLVSVCVCIVD